MKDILVILFLIVIFAFIECSKNEKANNLPEQKAENSQIDKPNSVPSLEINEDAQGMWDITGKTLFFRLYKDGTVEFEYPENEKKIAGKINKAEEINLLKRIKLSEDEMRKFADLLNTEDFQKTKNDYKRSCCCTDAIVDYKINLNDSDKQKNITLKGYCGLNDLKNPQASNVPDFPKVLSDLMILVDNIRGKYISQ